MNGNLQRAVEGMFRRQIDRKELTWHISFLRTLLLIHLMDQVLDFNVGKPNITTCRHFDTLPLICSKDMWEAETSAAWDFEYTRYLSSRKGTEMLRFGDLRKSSHLDVKDLDKNMVLDLSNWATNVDSFGSMILSICRASWSRLGSRYCDNVARPSSPL
ncbi:hypothetical protein DL98DRAFT_513301, partial [Cadophora sp. DSE1049]